MPDNAVNMYLHYHRQYDDYKGFNQTVHEMKTLKQDIKDRPEVYTDIKIPKFDYFPNEEKLLIKFEVEYIRGKRLDHCTLEEFTCKGYAGLIWINMIKQTSPNFCDLNMSNFIIQRSTKQLYFVDLQSFDRHLFDHPIMTFVKYLHFYSLHELAPIKYDGDENRLPERLGGLTYDSEADSIGAWY